MAKKEWREVPESELTEEEVRRWFVRLRELYREERHRVHNMKVERGQLRVKICELESHNAHLRKVNAHLEQMMQKKKEKKSETPKTDFKKKFLDSL